MVLVGALNWRILFLNQDTPHFKPPPALGCCCPSISSLPSRAVRALKPLNTLLATAAIEAQHHPGLVTQAWNTQQALTACTWEETGGKRQGRSDPRSPRDTFTHGSREQEGFRAGTGELRADTDSHTTPGYSQTHSATDPPIDTQPLQPGKG